MVKVVDLDKLAERSPDIGDVRISHVERAIRKRQPRSGSNLEGRTQPVLNEEGEPKHGRKEWAWNRKNAEPGPVTVIKYKK